MNTTNKILAFVRVPSERNCGKPVGAPPDTTSRGVWSNMGPTRPPVTKEKDPNKECLPSTQLHNKTDELK